MPITKFNVTLKCSEILTQLRIYISEELRARVDEELEGDIFLTFDFLSDDILRTETCKEGMICFPYIRIDGGFVHFTLSPQMQVYFISIAETTASKRDLS